MAKLHTVAKKLVGDTDKNGQNRTGVMSARFDADKKSRKGGLVILCLKPMSALIKYTLLTQNTCQSKQGILYSRRTTVLYSMRVFPQIFVLVLCKPGTDDFFLCSRKQLC